MRGTLRAGYAGATLLALLAAGPALASKADAPVPGRTAALMREKGMAPGAGVLVRVFKKEAELEIWKQRADGRYALLKTFPVCRWSGRLGPKRKTGDRQAPEGFYDITPRLMNPNSAYHLSFDTGFPNAYDRANGYTGSYLMVHGVCSSMGCYAMTNAGIEEVYALLRDAFKGGQKSVQFQAFPFRMTARNMARMRDDPDIDFWRQLKAGNDRFEATGLPPRVTVAGKRYAFTPYRERALEAQAKARLHAEQEAIARQIDDGAPSIRITYADGGMHPHFARMRNHPSLGIISRPEALAFAGRDVVIRPGVRKAPPVMVAQGAVSLTFARLASGPGAGPAALRLPATDVQASQPSSPSARIALAHDGARAAMASAASTTGTPTPVAGAYAAGLTSAVSSWPHGMIAMGPSAP